MRPYRGKGLVVRAVPERRHHRRHQTRLGVHRYVALVPLVANLPLRARPVRFHHLPLPFVHHRRVRVPWRLTVVLPVLILLVVHVRHGVHAVQHLQRAERYPLLRSLREQIIESLIHQGGVSVFQ